MKWIRAGLVCAALVLNVSAEEGAYLGHSYARLTVHRAEAKAGAHVEVSDAEHEQSASALALRAQDLTFQPAQMFGSSTCLSIASMQAGMDDATGKQPKKITNAALTVEACYYACNPAGTLYFGMRGGDECVCFDLYEPGQNRAICDAACGGNSSQTCGGKSGDSYSVHLIYAWMPQTIEKPCGPVKVENAVNVCPGGGGDHNKTCQFSCAFGYRLSENTLLCDTAVGQWLGQATCSEVLCNLPPPIPGARETCSKASAVKDGGRCKVECAVGHELIQNTLQCRAPPNPAADQGTYLGQAICKPVSCGKPPAHKFANVIGSEVDYPTQVQYTCELGFTLNGQKDGGTNYIGACAEDGKFFFESQDRCKAIVCGAAPAVKRAKLLPGPDSNGVISFPMVAKYVCQDGYTVDGTAGGAKQVEVSCQASGAFTAVPECKPVVCGPAPAVLRADTIVEDASTVYSFYEVVVHKCKPGFSLDPMNISKIQFQTMCSEDGTFHGAQDCQPVFCGLPPAVPNTQVATVEAVFPMSVTYKCENGYTLDGTPQGETSFSIKCQADRTFENTQECKPIRCPGPPYLPHASLTEASERDSRKGIDFPMIVQYKCEDGYSTDRSTLAGSKILNIQCLASGEYSKPAYCEDINDCLGHTCGSHGQCVDLHMDYTCKCEPGYEMTRQDGELVCGDIDECGPQACGKGGVCKNLVNDYTCDCKEGYELATIGKDKICRRVSCGVPPEAQKATAPLAKAAFEDTVDFTCDTGYTLDGTVDGAPGFTVTCLATGVFSQVKVCKPIACGSAPSVTHANIETAGVVVFPNIAQYRCARGYTVDGLHTGNTTFSLSCTSIGTFSVAQACKPVRCGVPPRVAMAQVEEKNFFYGDMVEYTCAEGYAPYPSNPKARTFTASCTESGEFDGVKSCEPVTCVLPETVPLASAPALRLQQRAANEVPTLSYPKDIEYVCDRGHTLTGKATGKSSFLVSCNAEGALEGMRDCKPVVCSDLPEIPHASLEKPLEDGETKTLLYRENITYVCDDGFAVETVASDRDLLIPPSSGRAGLQTTFSIQCRATGDFTNPPKCKNIDDCYGHSCGAPAGKCIDGINNYTCQCEEGFEENTLPGGEKICGDVNDCPPGACGPHGSCIDLVTDYSCMCQEGFEMVNVTKKDRVCKAMKCPEITPVPYSSLTQPMRLEYPEVVQVKCNPGYSVDGTRNYESAFFSIQCRSDGTYAPMPSCRPIQCGIAPAVVWAATSPPPTQVFSFGEEAKYTCAQGYSLDGSASGVRTISLPCGTEGRFPPAPPCRPVTCGAPPLAGKASVDASEVFFSGVAVYVCDQGYVTAKGRTDQRFSRECLASGQFSPLPEGLDIDAGVGSCVRLSCGEPPSLQYTAYQRGERFFGDAVEYKCEDGLTVDGTLGGINVWSIRCQPDGTFSTPLATTCQPVVFRIAGSVSDATDLHRLAGAEVTLKRGDTIISKEMTDSQGNFQVNGVAGGRVVLQATLSKYIAASTTFVVDSHIDAGGPADIVMSPEMLPGDWRIVLSWAATPPDLDAHLFFGNRGSCHMYYSNPRMSCGGILAVLDVDKGEGFGPETVTLKDVAEGCRLNPDSGCDLVFKTFIYNARGKTFPSTEATVKVYRGSKEMGAFNTAAGDGYSDDDWWSAFRIDARDGTVHKCTTASCERELPPEKKQTEEAEEDKEHTEHEEPQHTPAVPLTTPR